MSLSRDTVYIRGPVQERPWSLAEQRLYVARPSDLLISKDSLFVLDRGNHQLVVFDPSLTPIRSIGTEGKGPGELSRPSAVRETATGFAIAELSGQRVSFFRRDGSYEAGVIIPYGVAAFEPRDAGVLLPSSGAELLTFVTREGQARTITDRPPGLSPLVYDYFELPWKMDLVVESSGSLHVLDNVSGVLVKVQPDGSFVSARRLPEEILTPLAERIRKVDKGFQTAPAFTPLFASLSSTTDQAHILLLTTMEEIPALLIHPEDYTARPIAGLPGSDVGGLLKGAHAVLDNDRLYSVNLDGITVFEVVR